MAPMTFVRTSFLTSLKLFFEKEARFERVGPPLRCEKLVNVMERKMMGIVVLFSITLSGTAPSLSVVTTR